ncbi:histidine kinase famiy protein [Rubellimicrobium roseum]|uniref:histidine kinase n=1 Tax=Rubellimicrobium roseum TaxID=687525 RepID=A0A5C4NCY6_9RHOB|nr:histidine kinase famiy protein [Rubellimicrobium roseum]TNC67209.1 response regulator [Rubellimicrobium roseum]
MSADEQDDLGASAGRVEFEGGGPGAGGSAGIPAGDALADDSAMLAGRHQGRHWRESTITDDDLSKRGGPFFAAVEMTRMPMILTDPRQPDNPIVFANKAFLDLTGYEEQEVLGRNCRFLQGPKTDRDTVSVLRDAVKAHEPVSLEILNYKRDGTPFWNAVFIGPVHNPQGELLYFFASQLDVTRRRASEDSFRQAQKMEAVGQLTAGLAHDFNNLLTAIAGNLERLQARLEQPDLRRRLDVIQIAADRAAHLTRQLLAFARKTALDPKPIDLSDAVLGFVDLLETTAGSGVELRLDLRRRLPACLVDRTHLESALLNAVANARDAMPKGGEITIATSRLHLNGDALSRELPSGDYVVLEVRDEGEGMPPSVVARAAEPFFTTKSQGKGTGLGLAMVHGFLQQSRGRLEIESEVGRGTTIRMILPAHMAASEVETRGELVEPAKLAPRLSAENSKLVLVVEDNEDIMALARETLEEMGHRVLTATSGDEALRLLHREGNRVDLLFTDLIMPGNVNGLGLASELRARAPEVPVLLTTGYNEELAQGTRVPGMDVLAKPYRRAELMDRVRGALARHGEGTKRRRASDFGPAQE